jgi:hypothetical protein
MAISSWARYMLWDMHCTPIVYCTKPRLYTVHRIKEDNHNSEFSTMATKSTTNKHYTQWEFEVPESKEASYEEGEPRKHHSLYLSSGDIVIQVRILPRMGVSAERNQSIFKGRDGFIQGTQIPPSTSF